MEPLVGENKAPLPSLNPLEPLSAAEVEASIQLLTKLAEFNSTTRIISIMLKEPPKDLVYLWPNGPSPDREATAVCFDNAINQAYSIVLNLATGASRVELAPKGSQPTMSVDEQIECEQAVLNSKEFQEAIRKHHGITDPSLVMVDIWSAGNYGTEEDSTRRLARPLCFLRSDPTDNGYARPIEGIRPVVDLNLMQVIRVEEFGSGRFRRNREIIQPPEYPLSVKTLSH
jgi:primary-amine oxidase